jgi:hypothetical protein
MADSNVASKGSLGLNSFSHVPRCRGNLLELSSRIFSLLSIELGLLCVSLLFSFGALIGASGSLVAGVFVPPSLVWPKSSVLRVCFFDGTPQRRRIVVKAISEWLTGTSLRADSGDDEAPRTCARGSFAEVRIDLENVKSFGEFGTRSLKKSQTEPTVGLENNASDEYLWHLALHEIGHVLGLAHEDKHPRNPCRYFLNRQAMMADGYSRDRIENDYMPYKTQRITSFDHESIMFIGAYPNWLSEPRQECLLTSDRNKLSRGDIELIQMLYGSAAARQ